MPAPNAKPEPIDHAAFIARHAGRERPRPPGPPGPIALPDACGWGGAAGAVAGALVVAVLALLALYFAQGVAWALPAAKVAGASALVAGAVWATCRYSRARWGDPALLSAIIYASPAAHMVTDTDGRIVYITPGLSAHMPPGAPRTIEGVAQIFEDADIAALGMRRLADAALEADGEEAHVHVRLRGQGQDRTLRVEVHRLATQHDGLLYWRAEDVTRDWAQNVAAEAERARLIDFTDNAPVGFFSLDGQGRFVFANATLARWLGRDLAALVASDHLHTYMVTPPCRMEDREAGHCSTYDLDAAQAGATHQAVETYLKGPGGTTFLAAISQTITRDAATGAVRTRGVVHDLTAERTMRRALEASEDRFRRFFEQAPVGIALLGPDDRIADCNRAFAAMLGMPEDAATGAHLEALVAEADRAGVFAHLSAIREGRPARCSVEATLSGRIRPVVTRLYAQRFEGDGQGAGAVLHFIDMTIHRELEAQVAQSQKMQAVGQLAGGIAHDFNNLLTAMIGFCDLLLLRHRPGDPSFSDIMQVKQNANRASNLVRQILAFSRQQTLRPRVLDITEVLTELSHLLRRLLGAHIKMDIEHGAGLGPVKVDPMQLEQVLINLAVNARDAMGGAGTLTLTTMNYENEEAEALQTRETLPPGRWVAMTVADTGCGMDSGTIARIFEPFFTTKPQGQGTGLGLATVYGIVRQTDGYLDVRSVPGEGTQFTIYLPRAEGEVEACGVAAREREGVQAADPGQDDLTGSSCIVLVEDEDAVRAFSQRALEGKGYRVLAAASGPNALALLDSAEAQAAGCPDLLVTDVVMPEMDGTDLAKAMRERFPGLKIIFISGYTEDRLKAHMGPGIWFLPKPFTLRQLAAKVKDVLQDGAG
jgi:two-component system, cell cycle sensor histidine kinase and response regulator CckA